MSKIEVDAIEPQSGTSLTLGASGDTITVPAGAIFDSSAATNTLPSTVVTTTGTQTLTNKSIVASQLTGTVATSNLGTGTADATTFLRGDNTFNAPPLGGITMADQWRITADASAGVLTANWERADTLAAGFIGTGLSESSGIFSFPSTGIYMINANGYMAGSGTVNYGGIQIQVTTDNSTYNAAAQNFSNAQDAQNFSVFVSYMFDVTNTTNDKFRLNASANDNTTWGGGTSDNLTSVSVIRLGDT